MRSRLQLLGAARPGSPDAGPGLKIGREQLDGSRLKDSFDQIGCRVARFEGHRQYAPARRLYFLASGDKVPDPFLILLAFRLAPSTRSSSLPRFNLVFGAFANS